jgi:hypothetical protein
MKHTLLLWLTLWGKVLLEVLIVPRIVNKFPSFYRIQMFITVFTTARHWPLSCVRWIQSTLFHPISQRSILILFFHRRLGLPSGLFPSGFPIKILNAFLIFPMRALITLTSHSLWFDYSNSSWWSVQVTKFLIIQSSPASRYFLPLRPKQLYYYPSNFVESSEIHANFAKIIYILYGLLILNT